MHDLWRMKLVVISHACVTPQNQAFFQHISEVAGWNVTIILPKQWKTDFNDRYAIQKLPGFKGEIIPVSVHLKGRIPLHFYHFGLFRAISRERPDIIYVHNESYALSTFQVMLFNFLFLRKTVGFYAAQNIIKKYLLPFRLIEKFNFRQADYCFPVTESAAVALREKGFAGRIAVLPLGAWSAKAAIRDRLCRAAGSRKGHRCPAAFARPSAVGRLGMPYYRGRQDQGRSFAAGPRAMHRG
jgi:hypothetical protein